MKHLKVHPEVLTALENFTMPEEIGFGKVLSPIMVTCTYKKGEWGPLELLPYAPITLDPTAKVLHYAQEIFEGMKAYHVDKEGPFLFRPDENLKRFNMSAERMAMPSIPEEFFLEAVTAITHYSKDFIPPKTGDSLYVRPFMFATENSLGIKPSEEFLFMVVASPSTAYFKSGSLSVFVEEEAIRACPGGVGAAKTGGNYAASLQSTLSANKLGYMQVLWLDALEKKYIEELSGMNFFAVIDDVIITPALTNTILNGITRKSLIQLAKYLKMPIEERPITFTELATAIKEGRCSECFSCGTAVIITPIELFGTKTEQFKLPFSEGPVAKKIKAALLDIQEGRAEDPFNWRYLAKL